MRILFTRFPYESRKGGAEKQLMTLMKGLRERGHEVSFLGSCPVLLEEAGRYLLTATRLDIGPPPVTKWTALSFAWRRFSMRKKLIKAFSTFHFPFSTLVMVSMTEKLLLTRWAVEHGINVIWIEHDSVGRWLTKNPWLLQLKKLSGLATTVCVSELSRRLYVELGWSSERVIAIPNGVTVSEGRAPASAKATSGRNAGSELRLGCLARLDREKGIDVLIDAAKELKNVQLTIVGTGPERAALEDEKRQTKNDKRITILDNVPTLADFYASLDIFVLPSRTNDPFGMVAAEAMLMGIPVIVTDQCGIAGYLHDGVDSLIVPAGSSTALAEAISRMREPESHDQIKTAGQKLAQRLFTIDRMVESYEALLT